MLDELVFEVQRLYPQIYLACHVDHVRARSTQWRLSSRDSSVLSHLDRDRGMSPRELAAHLAVAPSTLSATIARLVRLGYMSSGATTSDKRERELRLTSKGAEAMASTSVLDAEKVRSVLKKMNKEQRADAIRGLQLFARAARELEEEA